MVKLWPWRFWRLRLFLAYIKKYDLIFYPGVDVADYWGIKFTKLFRKRTKIVATLEGLVGDASRDMEYTAVAGHPVTCHKVPKQILRRVDYVLTAADQIIAISSFLAKIGRSRYGDKTNALQLGYDGSIFFHVGDEDRESFYTEAAGHPVYCQRVSPKTLRRVDGILHAADHVIAISPFLARMGSLRYGDKFSVLPLGVDTANYRPSTSERCDHRPVVVTAGTVYPGKRPDTFLQLAQKFPEAAFRWFGAGDMLEQMRAKVRELGLHNLHFAGPLSPQALAEEFRKADIFVLPSKSEGVPKVTQEAAACGLPVVLFGFYEAPSVVDGENGYVVWNDEELMDRLINLLGDVELRRRMGDKGVAMAQDWEWSSLSQKWERGVLSHIGA
ncbi:glycosyltransferase family 4 protein [Thiohalocapsa marina]|uniref:glycosyltransferase family 4 protein n=1 Tax=Thiohalocapsa marina TaxID=424902 RepID=UPI001478A9E2|nr:glycosyltransferase family 4 protein [Thiohalocapsa marina]